MEKTNAPAAGSAWPGGCWPDETQLLLLKACLLEDEGASLEAWRAWSGRASVLHLDPGSSKLLPLLYRRLRALQVTSDILPRLQGVVRYQWVRSTLLLRDLEPTLRVLNRAGIESLLLKGAALNGTVYPRGSRVMDDLDVFVPRAKALAAIDALKRDGWQTEFRIPERLIAVTHSIPFSRGEGELDLHWDLCHGRFLDDRAQQDLWQAGTPIRVGDEPTRILCPADQLLHTCEHGVRYNPMAPLRWLADATHVLRGAGPIDWQRVAAMARRHQMILPLRETLDYLRRHFGVRIPPAARESLRGLRPSLATRLEHFLATRKSVGSHPFFRTLPANCFHYLRARRSGTRVGLGEYLQLVNDLPHSLARRAVDRVWLEVTGACSAVRRSIRLGAARGEWFLSMHHPPAGSLAGFYPPEVSRAVVFRWTKPRAEIALPLRQAPHEISLHLAPVREWPADLRNNLSRNLSIRLNRSAIATERCRFEERTVTFTVEPAMLTGHDHQKLELHCPAWEAEPGALRPLGIPLVGIRYRELAGNAGEAT